nr:MAG TPA: hypothetical protein [Bacteriophage sp.]
MASFSAFLASSSATILFSLAQASFKQSAHVFIPWVREYSFMYFFIWWAAFIILLKS